MTDTLESQPPPLDDAVLNALFGRLRDVHGFRIPRDLVSFVSFADTGRRWAIRWTDPGGATHKIGGSDPVPVLLKKPRWVVSGRADVAGSAWEVSAPPRVSATHP